MQPGHTMAYLRQLCCSGLAKEVVIPEFLRAAQRLIPSANNTFTFLDQRFAPTFNLYEHASPENAELVLRVMAGYFTAELSACLAMWFSRNAVLTNHTVLDPLFYKSDFYHLVLRPTDQHHPLCAPVLCNGKPSGTLTFFRPRTQKPFNEYEQAVFARLLPYVAHALNTQVGRDTLYSETGSMAMMILDTKGRILYSSPEAEYLLALIYDPNVSLRPSLKKEALLARLAQLCRNQQAIFMGRDAPPPSFEHITPHGRFSFRAFWLEPRNCEPGGLVGLTIEHQEPLLLKILRGVENLPLSPTQKQVAVLLAQNVSSEKIGERLHIKQTTLKDHIRKIFTKLDLHRREELLPKLLASDRGAAPGR